VGQTLQSVRKQQSGSELADLANKAEQMAAQQQDFEQRLRRNFGQAQGSQQTAQQMADEKQKQLDAYNQLQKQMQQAARNTAGTQPGVSKDLRDAIGKSQQAEIGTKMEFTEEALRRGLGQYAVMREAPVTQALNDLRDQLKKVEAEASSQQGNGAAGDDNKSQIAMQQALAQTEKVRREMEQLSRARGQQQGKNGQNGNQPGQQSGQQGQQGQQAQQGQQGQQGGQQGQQAGQQGQGQQAGQQGQQGQQGGQQGGGQQGGSQQAGGMSPRGGGSRNGGGYGVNNGPRTGYAGGYGDQPYGATDFSDTRMGELPPNFSPETAYNDLMRDIGRLRNSVADDKELNKEYQDLVRRAQELDPRHMTNDGRLGAVIGQQALSEIDELELVLRRKLAANDGSVRSTSPRNIPPGYAEAIAEYNKRLSKQ